jgi:alkylated DNA nucleotide flippase Atl1
MRNAVLGEDIEMTELDIPLGAVVTYLDTQVTTGTPFKCAVARGIAVQDPRTHNLWVVVVDAARTAVLIDSAFIVEVAPPPSAARLR